MNKQKTDIDEQKKKEYKKLQELLSLENRTFTFGSLHRTPIMIALQEKMSIVSDLIKKPFNIDTTDSDGWTALMYASQHDPSWIPTLLQFKPNLDLKNHYNQTALTIACIYQVDAVYVKELLKFDNAKNINVVDRTGNTCLMRAVQATKTNRNNAVVLTLLEYNPDLSLINTSRESVVDIAHRENQKLYQLLLIHQEKQNLIKETNFINTPDINKLKIL